MKSHPILTREEIAGFVRLIGQTREHEITCGECLDDLAEFAERRLEGSPRSLAMRHVEHHLLVCPECREEYEALQRLLRDDSQESPAGE